MYSCTPFLTSALDRGEWYMPGPGRFTPAKDPGPIVHEPGWAPVPVCTGAKYLILTGFRSPDGSARSVSIYRLHYPGPHN